MRKVVDILPTRRDAVKYGTLSLLGAFAETALWPPRLRAAGHANPRGTARNCIVVEAAGAISHVETFDFKEDEGTQADFDIRRIRDDLYLSYRLFPQLSSEMDKVSIVRTFKSHEVVHFRGEYYTRAGRPLNPAQAAEIPPVGSVVAYELEAQRKETDTFPTYVSCNLKNVALPSGFLHPRFSGLDVNAKAGAGSVAAKGEALELLEERFSLLTELEKAVEADRGKRGRAPNSFRSFQEDAYRILGDTRWPRALTPAEEDKKRYGDNDAGLGCLMARNLIQADAGTRYVHVKHGGWDHHKNIYDHARSSNHYIHCNDLDRALANLLRDLAATPSKYTPGKTLLDETLVVVPTEFGRVPGKLNLVGGRHHYNQTYIGLFAGGGVKGGRVIGRTDATGENVVETGWRYGMQPKTENIYASVYSALGIDWRKEILNTPSKRAYRYVDHLGATEMCIDDEIAELFV
ncbi:MAG: DUF1501 domain-containing protein [Planctomycetota bacterium]|nr:DUF1501 domain-containing protein [Planctomycetota bacterium]